MLLESKENRGFYQLPLPNCDYVINREGVIVNETRGRALKPSRDGHGYRFISLRVGFPKCYRTFKIHRLVAIMFVEKPNRHKDKNFAELQVNHKDGNKENNTHLNLEWVTGEENLEHARLNSLYGSEKKVLARNVETGVLIEFRSVSECARWLCMSSSRLSAHLHSVCAGMIEKDSHVFKFKDEKDWPVRINYDKDTTTLHYIADVIAENVNTGEKFLCKTLIHAIGFVGFTRNQVMNHRARHGHGVPYKGWIFYQFKPER